MSRNESDSELGNPWLALVVGLACLALAWYVYAKVGTSPQLIGRAAMANSSLGKKLLIGVMAIVGFFFVYRGVAKLRSGH